MTNDELERDNAALRLAFSKERADHAATEGILRRVREGLMSKTGGAEQCHAIELAFALLAGAEGNDAAASAQEVATALLATVAMLAECNMKIAKMHVAIALAGSP